MSKNEVENEINFPINEHKKITIAQVIWKCEAWQGNWAESDLYVDKILINKIDMKEFIEDQMPHVFEEIEREAKNDFNKNIKSWQQDWSA